MVGTEVFDDLVTTLRMILSGTATSIRITLPRWAMAGGSQATAHTSIPITEILLSRFATMAVVHRQALVSSRIEAIPASHRVRLIATVAGRLQVVERAGGHPVHRHRDPAGVAAAVSPRAATHAVAAVTTEVAAVAGALPSQDANSGSPGAY